MISDLHVDLFEHNNWINISTIEFRSLLDFLVDVIIDEEKGHENAFVFLDIQVSLSDALKTLFFFKALAISPLLRWIRKTLRLGLVRSPCERELLAD